MYWDILTRNWPFLIWQHKHCKWVPLHFLIKCLLMQGINRGQSCCTSNIFAMKRSIVLIVIKQSQVPSRNWQYDPKWPNLSQTKGGFVFISRTAELSGLRRLLWNVFCTIIELLTVWLSSCQHHFGVWHETAEAFFPISPPKSSSLAAVSTYFLSIWPSTKSSFAFVNKHDYTVIFKFYSL